jgi:hypothetical protein
VLADGVEDFCATRFNPAIFLKAQKKLNKLPSMGFRSAKRKFATQATEEFIPKPLQTDGRKKDQ